MAEMRLIDFGLGQVRDAPGLPAGLRMCGRVQSQGVFLWRAAEEMRKVKNTLRVSE